MKVLDLQCAHGHVFEGWFASEDDFQRQLSSHLLSCPMCSDTSVTKLPSAPRLNLSTGGSSGAVEAPPTASVSGSVQAQAQSQSQSQSHEQAESGSSIPPAALQAAWMQAVRRVMANTEDVGDRFAEEARRMHYGEADERGIRGQATKKETMELLEEGIAVVPLPVPPGFKDTLQ